MDSTPLVGPDGDYCLSIGFTDGRTICPLRPGGSRRPAGLRGVEVGHRQGHRPARAHLDRHPQGRHDQLLHGAHGTVRAPPGRSVLGEGVQGRPLHDLHRGRGVRLGGRGPGALTADPPGGASAGRQRSRGRARPPRGAIVKGDLGRKLDAYLSRLEALGYSGGLAVVKGGETVVLKGYGQADREKGVPMRPDSVFNLGSITKPFTAAAILRLAGAREAEDERPPVPPPRRRARGQGGHHPRAPPHALLRPRVGLRPRLRADELARSTCGARSRRSCSSPRARGTSTRTPATACSPRSSSGRAGRTTRRPSASWS